MTTIRNPAVWFPAVRAGTGADVFTERLAAGLRECGIHAEIAWLPLRAEYAPWTVPVPSPPDWATVVHVNSWLHPRFLPKSLPVVVTIHHSVHDPGLRPYKGAARAAYHRLWIAPNERRVLRGAVEVVAVSRFVADMARRTLVDVPIGVVHNGVDIEKFRPGREMRHAGHPFKLLYVGGWKTLKGVDLLAPIMSELGNGFELRYTGGSAHRQSGPSVAPNMHDIGRLKGDGAVVAAMQEADALLFPSRSEGFGLVVAEAMACGLPVVATRGSSLAEIVDDKVTGFLCPRDDVAAFSEAVRTLAADATLRQAMARAARRRTAACFSAHGTLGAYAGIYGRAIGE